MIPSVTYTYYWWYKTIIILTVAGYTYYLGRLTYDIYLQEGVGFNLIAAFILHFIIFIALLWYVCYLMSYRLTVTEDRLTAQSIAGKKSTDRKEYFYDEDKKTWMYIPRNIFISIFCTGYLPLRRKSDDNFSSTFLEISSLIVSITPPVPSMREYRTHHICSIVVSLLAFPLFFYTWILPHIAPEPICYLCIYIAVTLGSIVAWNRYSQLNPLYFMFVLDLSGPLIRGVFWAWHITHFFGLHWYTLSGYMPYIIGSLGMSALLYLLLRGTMSVRKLYQTSRPMYHTLFLILPLFLYNLSIAINVIPYGSSTTVVQKTVYSKYHFSGPVIPTWSIETDGWQTGQRKEIIVLSTAYDSFEEGDSIAIEVHTGVLGIRWHLTSFLGSDSTKLRPYLKPR